LAARCLRPNRTTFFVDSIIYILST
jgi:hypothetical protein